MTLERLHETRKLLLAAQTKYALANETEDALKAQFADIETQVCVAKYARIDAGQALETLRDRARMEAYEYMSTLPPEEDVQLTLKT